jgi:16S rRNA (uracil1498-N3)-methyltransferase
MNDLFFLQAEDSIRNEQILMVNKLEVNHMINVLRKKTGDDVSVSDYKNLYKCSIIQVLNKQVALKIRHKISINYDKPKFILNNSLLKGSNFDLQLEKSVELGVDEFQPIISKHCIAIKNKVEKWESIILTASKQCKQAKRIPIQEPVKIDKLIKKDKSLWIVPELIENYEYIGYLEINFEDYEFIEIFIGPEGGFTAEEITFFERNNSKLVSLGPNRLRAETAAWAAITILKDMYHRRGLNG